MRNLTPWDKEPNFGWDYPPGAESDPRAPYNQSDPPDEDEVAEDVEPDWDSIAEQKREQRESDWEYDTW